MAAVSSPRTAGVAFAVTATAKDAFGNTKTGYSGVASLSRTVGDSASGCLSGHTTFTAASSYSCHPVYAGFGTWTNGAASANVTGYNAESGDTVTATDSGDRKSVV